jgi:hypothetical protein
MGFRFRKRVRLFKGAWINLFKASSAPTLTELDLIKDPH